MAYFGPIIVLKVFRVERLLRFVDFGALCPRHLCKRRGRKSRGPSPPHLQEVRGAEKGLEL